MDYTSAKKHIKTIISTSKSRTVLQDVVDFLSRTFEQYNWIGIYLVEGAMLVLGPWKGEHATEHIRIPIGKGICGSAARSGKTEVVSDVSKDSRYLSCFLSTRSEIVVPIKKKNKVIGEVDIDSDCPAAFTEEDVVFLEKVADMLSQHI